MNRKDEKIVDEAKKRFNRCNEWESSARAKYCFDLKFANGDSDNLYQWPQNVATDRNGSNRPCLTVNKTRQHCLQIINDQRQNKSQVEIRAVGDGATFKAAEVLEGIVRHIEYISNAQNAYANACYHQVVGGIGYWRVVTDYAHDDTFDQEIFIRRVADPLSVYLDPDISEADGSDARFGFVFDDMPRDLFEAQYPREDDVTDAPLGVYDGATEDGWESKDHVRVCEYYRKSDKPDRLHELDNGMSVRESDVIKEDKRRRAEAGDDADIPSLLDQLKINSVRSREISEPQIEWYLIAGSRIIDRKIWPGKYIPIVRVIGEETVIDGELDRKGHTRTLIDPQRIYNYWTSSAVEFVALQSKTPYITDVAAIDGYETNWANANIVNAAYLPYNGIREDGTKIERPERAPPPVMSQAYLAGMETSRNEMMMASGQYEANMGQRSNEVSGAAVDARQRQGANSTYHFIDRFSDAIRFTGRILVDLIPKVYDTERVINILGIDGTQHTVQVNPGLQDPQGNALAHQQVQDPDDQEYDPASITAIFNPNCGRYEVVATIGPAFETRRQETFNALSQILAHNEQLAPMVGDLMFKAADFPLADQIAARLHNLVPPQALGQGPTPQVQQMQQMLQQQSAAVQQLQAQLEQEKSKAAAVSTQKEIDAYNAETSRMKAVGAIDPEALLPLIRQMVTQVLGTPINPLIAAHRLENAQMAPDRETIAQAQQAQAQHQMQMQAAQVNQQQNPE